MAKHYFILKRFCSSYLKNISFRKVVRVQTNGHQVSLNFSQTWQDTLLLWVLLLRCLFYILVFVLIVFHAMIMFCPVSKIPFLKPFSIQETTPLHSFLSWIFLFLLVLTAGSQDSRKVNWFQETVMHFCEAVAGRR